MQHAVSAAQAGRRLQDVVRELGWFPSGKSAKAAIKSGQVLVDSAPGSTGWLLRLGQSLTLLPSAKSEPSVDHVDVWERVQRAFPTTRVIWQDGDLAAIWKPAGLLISGNRSATLRRALVAMLPPAEARLPGKPEPVHRLDRLTAGIVLVARHSEARVRLGQAFERGEIEKEYIALAQGRVAGQLTVAVALDERPSLTVARSIAIGRCAPHLESTLLKIRLHTGRTHQIRRHLAATGHPIVGDSLYTGPSLELRSGHGLYLAATCLRLAHPFHGTPLDLTAQPPQKFTRLSFFPSDYGLTDLNSPQ